MSRELLLDDAFAAAAVQRWWVDRGDTTLAAVSIGAPDRPSWVVAHGAGSSARFVASAFAAPVLAAGGRLVTYDLRGHGASSPAPRTEDHHLDVHAADLAAVTAHLEGDIEVVGGVSLGAHAAVRAVGGGGCPRPAAVLGCLPAWIGRSVAGTGAHAAIAQRVREVGVAAYRTAVVAEPDLAPWLREALSRDLHRHDATSLAAALLALDGAQAPTLEEVSRLGTPLAVLAWAGDPGHPLAAAERWVAAARHAHLARLELRELDVGADRLGARAVSAVARVTAAPPAPPFGPPGG